MTAAEFEKALKAHGRSGTVASNSILRHFGVQRLSDGEMSALTKMTDAELLLVPNFGKACLVLVRRYVTGPPKSLEPQHCQCCVCRRRSG